jgi:hypothetical protein
MCHNIFNDIIYPVGGIQNENDSGYY